MEWLSEGILFCGGGFGGNLDYEHASLGFVKGLRSVMMIIKNGAFYPET